MSYSKPVVVFQSEYQGLIVSVSTDDLDALETSEQQRMAIRVALADAIAVHAILTEAFGVPF